jgi:NAD(P)-dependent dehydrogenase (short-subunit alcohol dehydrogenase family)
MIEQRRGAVVHVGSDAARLIRNHPVAHSAAKAALTAYSKCLATEVGQHGSGSMSFIPAWCARNEWMPDRPNWPKRPAVIPRPS